MGILTVYFEAANAVYLAQDPVLAFHHRQEYTGDIPGVLCGELSIDRSAPPECPDQILRILPLQANEKKDVHSQNHFHCGTTTMKPCIAAESAYVDPVLHIMQFAYR